MSRAVIIDAGSTSVRLSVNWTDGSEDTELRQCLKDLVGDKYVIPANSSIDTFVDGIRIVLANVRTKLDDDLPWKDRVGVRKQLEQNEGQLFPLLSHLFGSHGFSPTMWP